MEVYEQIKTSALQQVDLHRANLDELSDAEVREYLTPIFSPMISEFLGSIQHSNYSSSNEILTHLFDDILGLGAIESLLRDESISEIMINRFDSIYLEKDGNLHMSEINLGSEQRLRQIIDRIVTPLGRRIDESSPMVDARLKCGSRVNAIVPPLAVDGSSVTIRKFSKKQLLLEDLVRLGSCSSLAAELLPILVQERFNIVVSGGTGSGKTTLLNILSSLIPAKERLVTIEDAAELKITHGNLVRLESRPSNQEGSGHVSIRQLVANALRMRPDRILVGECRAGEALDMLQAMNTGHNGSMTTIHANSCRDALARLETLVLMAGMDLPVTAIRQQISSAIHFIIQISRNSSGAREITSISEIQGIESGTIQVAELFSRSKSTGELEPTGEISKKGELLSSEHQNVLLQMNNVVPECF